ncbi:MAG: diadenosine tetraphosphate (Ap4A) HIT family hydrolase [Francisellaceae bacterium]|jgi:diadenosine tetraphosphate (Ap4A) HIT family hydrolase
MFELDQRLKNDCHVLATKNQCEILLMNNSLVPWLIIVPQTDKIELYELDLELKQKIYQTIDLLSEFIVQTYDIEKLNVAALGNVVSQLHIHIIGRSKNDMAWPNPVWGNIESQKYSDDQIKKIRMKLLAFI